ncbi:MAG: PDZ domain-containing protein [Saprospiraceae bacterium]
MYKLLKRSLSCVILVSLCSISLAAQNYNSNKEKEKKKEIIIIEKVKDENGNVISKKIIRSSNGDMTDQEIEDAIKESENITPFGKGSFDFNNFDFENLGFGNSEPEGHGPTLGVILSFETGQAVISKVATRSGAEEAELRKGDIIISVDGFVVNNIGDIKSYIEDKLNGDEVLLSIVRDGQSFEKKVALKDNNFGNTFGNFNPEAFKSFGQMFNFGDGHMPFNIDSLLNNFNEQDNNDMPFQFNLPNYSDRDVEEERPSLGVFIDEVDGGVLIAEIIEHSPAAKAKLKVNDKIVKIDGNEILSFDDLARIIRSTSKDTKILITYIRNGKTKEAEVTLQ